MAQFRLRRATRAREDDGKSAGSKDELKDLQRARHSGSYRPKNFELNGNQMLDEDEQSVVLDTVIIPGSETVSTSRSSSGRVPRF